MIEVIELMDRARDWRSRECVGWEMEEMGEMGAQVGVERLKVLGHGHDSVAILGRFGNGLELAHTAPYAIITHLYA